MNRSTLAVTLLGIETRKLKRENENKSRSTLAVTLLGIETDALEAGCVAINVPLWL